MPTVCRRFPGFRGWAGWGTSLIYTCLRGGRLPGSPGRSCGRPEGLVLLPIWPPRGPAHASTLTSLCYLPGDTYLPNVMHPPPPCSARHPPVRSPPPQPPCSAICSRPRPPTTPSPPSDLPEHLSIPHYSFVLRGLSLLFHLPSHPPTLPARLLISALCAGSWAGSWPQELVCLAHRECAG